jgi:hypothetical protein
MSMITDSRTSIKYIGPDIISMYNNKYRTPKALYRQSASCLQPRSGGSCQETHRFHDIFSSRPITREVFHILDLSHCILYSGGGNILRASKMSPVTFTFTG